MLKPRFGLIVGGVLSSVLTIFILLNIEGAGPELSLVDDKDHDRAFHITSGGVNSTLPMPAVRDGSLSPHLNPVMGPLENNGSSTKTHALLEKSPAIEVE
ncbi:MAG: choice-of-anchor Q domain-containing protein, partial [Anaerolineales bacterium]|nr:choice-of-anchor Q domain-containing protein [Anaerolineales bacterium]